MIDRLTGPPEHLIYLDHGGNPSFRQMVLSVLGKLDFCLSTE